MQRAGRRAPRPTRCRCAMELQADCFAGVWANNANRSRQILEQGDVEEGAERRHRHRRRPRSSASRSGYVVPDAFTHGSSAQRVRWFKRGLRVGQRARVRHLRRPRAVGRCRCATAGTDPDRARGRSGAETVGITLPHEHLLIDFKVMFAEPAAASDKGRAWEPVSLANLGWVRQNFNANLDNLRLTDEQVAADEILLFKHAGGQHGGRSDAEDARARSARARAHRARHRPQRGDGRRLLRGRVAPADMDRRTVDELAREMIARRHHGRRRHRRPRRALGEIGTTWPWTENEKKVLRAAVAAQRETGAPLMIHPGRHPRMPMELAEFVAEGGRRPRGARSCATSAARSPTSRR